VVDWGRGGGQVACCAGDRAAGWAVGDSSGVHIKHYIPRVITATG
jgi:hypothetical protein